MGFGAGYNAYRKRGGNPFLDAVSGYAGGLAARHKAEREKLQLAGITQQFSQTKVQELKATQELVQKELYQTHGARENGYSHQEQTEAILKINPGLAADIESIWNHPAYRTQRDGLSGSLKGDLSLVMAPNGKIAVTMKAGQNGNPDDDPERVGVITDNGTKAANDPVTTSTPFQIMDRTIDMLSAKAGYEDTLSATDTLTYAAGTDDPNGFAAREAAGLGAPVQTNQEAETNAAAASTAVNETVPEPAPRPDIPDTPAGNAVYGQGIETVEPKQLQDADIAFMGDDTEKEMITTGDGQQIPKDSLTVTQHDQAGKKAAAAGDVEAVKEIKADKAKMVDEVSTKVPDMAPEDLGPREVEAVGESLRTGNKEFDYYTKTAAGRAGLVLAAKRYGLPTVTTPSAMAEFINTGKFPDPLAATALKANIKAKADAVKAVRKDFDNHVKMGYDMGENMAKTAPGLSDEKREAVLNRFNSTWDYHGEELTSSMLEAGVNGGVFDITDIRKATAIAAQITTAYAAAELDPDNVDLGKGRRAGILDFLSGMSGEQAFGEGYDEGLIAQFFTGENEEFLQVMEASNVPANVIEAIQTWAVKRLKEGS